MNDTLDSNEVRSFERFSRVARGLGKHFAATIILGGGGAAFAPSNETAIAAAATGFTIDVIRFLRDGGEQFMADMRINSGAQKAVNKKMEAQYQELVKKRGNPQKNPDDDDLIDRFNIVSKG